MKFPCFLLIFCSYLDYSIDLDMVLLVMVLPQPHIYTSCIHMAAVTFVRGLLVAIILYITTQCHAYA